MLQQTFAYNLEKKAALHPDNAAVFEPYNLKRHTYRDLSCRSNKLANALASSGIAKGDRIGCLTANSVEYIDLFMAASRLGAILCPLNYRLAPAEMIGIIGDARPKGFVFDGEFGAAGKEIVSANPDLKSILYFGVGDFDWAERMEEQTSQHSSIAPEIASTSNDPLLMLYTAGSTGRPKGVPLTQSNLFFNSINWILDLGITRADYGLTVLPLFHIGGHMLWLLPHLLVGAKVMLQRRFDPEMTLRLCSQEKVTNTYLIPAMAKMVLALPNWKTYDLSTIRFIGAGGEAVAEKITRGFGEVGIPVLNSYGLTETSDGTMTVRPEDGMGRPANCIGRPLTLTDIRIVDAEGHDVGEGVEGELLHRGPSVVDKYWNRMDETTKAFRDGWLHTGDIGTRDEKGFYYFIGRKDDLIITGGENVYPAEVEEAILGYSKVADVAVLGVPDDKWGQTVKAIIVPKNGMVIENAEINNFLKTKLSKFKIPRIYFFINELPKMGSGKMDRVQIKKSYGMPKK
jgi:fatty-acyl-CoA synthase